MKEMWLKHGKSAILDDDDFKKLSAYTWRAMEVSGKTYAVRSAGFLSKDNIYMHREIMGETGRKQIAHKNGNTLDNRKENLEYRKKVKKKRAN